jgi:RimJ/RimL family protein N-acetyltransferase
METARLHLRPLAEGDLDALVELDGFEVVRATIDPFGEHIPGDVDARREYERGLVRRDGFLGAVQRSSGRLVGWFQLEPADAGSEGAGRELELGYRLRPDVWGQGLATEGARALLEAALAGGEADRVFAHALLSNRGSIRVLEKIGMRYAGPWAYRGLPGAEYEAVASPPGADGVAGADAVAGADGAAGADGGSRRGRRLTALGPHEAP